jgi:hypothetical protein
VIRILLERHCNYGIVVQRRVTVPQILGECGTTEPSQVRLGITVERGKGYLILLLNGSSWTSTVIL